MNTVHLNNALEITKYIDPGPTTLKLFALILLLDITNYFNVKF